MKQTNVRLSDVARDNLARLQSFYGTNATATLSFVLAESVRRLPPAKPFTLPSPEVQGDEDIDWRRTQLATHTRLSEADALDLALREALDRRGLPEEPNDSATISQRASDMESASA